MAKKQNKSKQVALAPVVELEQVKTGGLGIDDGIILATFLMLVTAIALVLVASKAYPPLGG
ncbi:hypothetical protein LBMAG49_24440 [Planctomycetota bacterium]|nr:hypothetical protein [Planctomycetota bacterium]MSR39550.1 hypothetical protein [Planctomycetota bacterium]GDY03115.1 hypothetical protein LBMAG49_24440 [Planctomycetota bacterium]